MFGLTFDKLILVGMVALVIVGPTRLPGYATKLARYAKAARGMLDNAKARMSEELGPDFDDVDWKKLDPRQYDPRRIIRSALLDDEPAEPAPDLPKVTIARSAPKTTPNPASFATHPPTDAS